MNDTVLNSSSGSSSSEYPAPFSKSLILAIVIVHASQILVGFPTNLGVCFILYKRKNLRKVSHVLLGNLLIGALVTAIYIPLRLAINVMDQVLHKPVHGCFCVVAQSSALLFFSLQTLTLVAMAIDRYDCVMHPFKRRITVTNVHKVIGGIWLVAGITATFRLISAVFIDYANKCYISAHGTKTSFTFTLALTNIYMFVTRIVIFTTFVRILKKLRASPFAESNQNMDVRVTRFSYMLLFFFIASWIPLSSFSIGVKFLTDFTVPEIQGVKVLLLAMSNLNYVVNPFIHMNILKVAPRAAGPARSRNEDQQKERPVEACIDKKSEANEQ